MLAEELILVSRCQRGVAVGRADNAELVRVYPHLRFQQQPALQGFANIFAGEHVRSLGFVAQQVADLPAGNAEASELVIRRKERMRFAVALDLGDLDHRLQPGAALGIGRRHWPTARLRQFEHQAVGQVRVVRDRQHPPAGRHLIGFHVVPDLVRGRLVGRVDRHNRAHLVRTIAENDVAVQVIAALHQRVFEAEECGELARFVVIFDRIDVAVPDRFGPFGGIAGIKHRFGKIVATAGIKYLRHRALRALRPFVHHVVPAAHGGIGDQQARGIVKRLGRAQSFGVIGHDQEVQRAGQLGL